MNSATGPADRTKLQTRLLGGAQELNIAIDTSQTSQLLDYLELLARWNAVYNLTAVRDPRDMVTRHLLDSLAIAPQVRGATLVDLGSGPGLPGIPLAILHAARSVTLVDSNGKKIRFLREAVRSLGLNQVRVEQSRAEDFQGQFDCVVSRAFASLADMLRFGGHLIAPGGVCLAMKGVLDEDEIRAVPGEFCVDEILPLRVPDLGAARHLVIIRRSDMAVASPPLPQG